MIDSGVYGGEPDQTPFFLFLNHKMREATSDPAKTTAANDPYNKNPNVDQSSANRPRIHKPAPAAPNTPGIRKMSRRWIFMSRRLKKKETAPEMTTAKAMGTNSVTCVKNIGITPMPSS